MTFISKTQSFLHLDFVPKYDPPKRSWFKKFGDSFRGFGYAVATQNSFWAHISVAVAVFIAGVFLGVSAIEFMVLVLCISMVMAMELINTSVELLAKQVTDQESKLVKDSLDIASASVLASVLGSITIGLWILLPKFLGLFD